MASCSKMPFENKKELIEEEPPFLENTQNKRYYSFSKQAQPNEVSAMKPKKRMSEVEELNASLKKMVFEESEEHCYSDENIDSGNMEAI